MKVIAKVMLQYGIIRAAGTEFELTDPAHFDKRVMGKVEADEKPTKKAAKPVDDEAAKADEAARKAEAERLEASNAQAKADEAKPDAPAQPVSRRRSTADTK